VLLLHSQVIQVNKAAQRDESQALSRQSTL
jgi:hypothetical protein